MAASMHANSVTAVLATAKTRHPLRSPATRLVLGALLLLTLVVAALAPQRAAAANVQFVGNVGYTYVGNVVVLTANEVANLDSSGISGTLRLELWAFPAPYTGAVETGYKLAEYTLGQLVGGFHFSSISSGDIPFTPPPDGTWIFTMFVSEYTGAPLNDGYAPDDWSNFSTPVVIGSPPPSGGPPPPALTPKVGLWWNPNESGSGYAFDFTSGGILVVTIYSYQSNGTPQWYLATGPLSGYTFTSTLDKYVGGQCISCAYSGGPTIVGNDGVVTITFSSPTSATMYLPGGRVTAIQPEF